MCQNSKSNNFFHYSIEKGNNRNWGIYLSICLLKYWSYFDPLCIPKYLINCPIIILSIFVLNSSYPVYTVMFVKYSKYVQDYKISSFHCLLLFLSMFTLLPLDGARITYFLRCSSDTDISQYSDSL